jgi:hypothetical protein
MEKFIYVLVETIRLLSFFFPTSRAEVGNVDKYVQMVLLFKLHFLYLRLLTNDRLYVGLLVY